MVHRDVIAIDGPGALGDVESALTDLVAGAARTVGDGVNYQLPTGVVGMALADYENEPGLEDLGSYTFAVDFEGPAREELAVAAFAALSERGWKLLWFRDGPHVIARYGATAA